MHEINIRLIESNSERDRLAQYVPNYRNLRGRDIFVQVDEFDMPIKGTHRIPELSMPDYTAPQRLPENVEYNFEELPNPKPENREVAIIGTSVPVVFIEAVEREPDFVEPIKRMCKGWGLNRYARGRVTSLNGPSEICRRVKEGNGKIRGHITRFLKGVVKPVFSAEMKAQIEEFWNKGYGVCTISNALGLNLDLVVEHINSLMGDYKIGVAATEEQKSKALGMLKNRCNPLYIAKSLGVALDIVLQLKEGVK